MKLNTITPGTIFIYNGSRYAHDLNGRSGGGKVAIINVETQEPLLVLGTTNVSIEEIQHVEEEPIEESVEENEVVDESTPDLSWLLHDEEDNIDESN